eukprot:5120050-Amphidinium_carterae.1
MMSRLCEVSPGWSKWVGHELPSTLRYWKAERTETAKGAKKGQYESLQMRFVTRARARTHPVKTFFLNFAQDSSISATQFGTVL